MTEPRKPTARRADGEPEHPYDPETGRFLDGPHPETETPPKAPKAEEGEQGK